MSAAYRPYRDEESVDGLESTSWTDHEPGTIQIYEKTTEELPFGPSSKRALWVQIALLLITGFLGFLLGYYSPFVLNEKDSVNKDDEHHAHHLHHHEHPELFEDPTIKERLLSKIDGRNILGMLNEYRDTNRIPGSSDDIRLALHIEKSFDEYGLDHMTTMNYTFATMIPRQPSVVKLLKDDNSTIYNNLLQESYPHEDMRPFLPLSQANATVITTDQVLYLNKGLKEDYNRLTNLGVSANDTVGKVLVIRQTFYQAHEVVILAQESGARAVLLFPDPEIYGSLSSIPSSVRLPNDAGRSHPTAWSNYGDLAALNLTHLNALGSKLGDKETQVLIPVIPISFDTAKKILLGLSGATAPGDWNCFDFTLHIGPSYRVEHNEDGRAKIEIEFFNEPTSITTPTVTGVISGSTEPDRYVIIGSRRDSLNRGLLDSISGTSVMLEIARVYGSLLKEGWRPKRTIIFNSFGAESLNLIGSSNWLETHQRVLHSRAVAYINCDQVVFGNKTVAVAASPLLFQTLYNATKQVLNPNFIDQPQHQFVYDAWKEAHSTVKSDVDSLDALIDPELEKLFKRYPSNPESRLPKGSGEEQPSEDDLGLPGSVSYNYRKSALIKTRPKVRRLDLHSIYSPFFLYAGIPVVDVRYAGFIEDKSLSSSLLEDTLPVLGTKYDNLDIIRNIDPHLKYHVAVAQVLCEIVRDVSSSVYLPFNLLDYAVTLKDSYNNFVTKHGKLFAQSNVGLDNLEQVILDFTKAALKFHHQQDNVVMYDSLQVRRLNDQLMLLERALLDSAGMPNYWERKHILLSPNDGEDHKEGFPGLVDWITLLDGDSLDPSDLSIFIEILKLHYQAVIQTISNAIKIIDDVDVL